jgi:Mn-containing catalase
MSLRLDRRRLGPPQPKDAPPDRVAAVQELLGGRSGETSALMNQACVSARK